MAGYEGRDREGGQRIRVPKKEREKTKVTKTNKENWKGKGKA